MDTVWLLAMTGGITIGSVLYLRIRNRKKTDPTVMVVVRKIHINKGVTALNLETGKKVGIGSGTKVIEATPAPLWPTNV